MVKLGRKSKCVQNIIRLLKRNGPMTTLQLKKQSTCCPRAVRTAIMYLAEHHEVKLNTYLGDTRLKLVTLIG